LPIFSKLVKPDAAGVLRSVVLQNILKSLYNAVMPRGSTLVRLADLAEDQWGLFTRRQAEATGMAWSTLARMADSGVIERLAHGVYRLRGAAPPDHLDLRVAWLQLAPGIPAWERTADDGVVSHRSATLLYGLGHLPADIHEFTVPTRRQTRRSDVRLHRGALHEHDWTSLRGILTTRPARIATDLLTAREDPAAVGFLVADALRGHHDTPETVASTIATHAARFGLRRADGPALLGWLLDLTDAPERNQWLDQAYDNDQSHEQ
jgi:predicted transcriptional regulator of viral defense system